MTQRANAMPFPRPAFRPQTAALPDIRETLAAIVAAGEQIADLKAQLAAAKRSLTALQIDKRALEGELREMRAARVPTTRPNAAAVPAPNRSRLDDALSAIAEGLGPSLVRVS